MSAYASSELEALVTCPYNVSHRVAAKRFTTHLVKCRKANPNVEMVTCLLYAEHKVPKPELAYHVEHCSKRKDFDRQVFQDEVKPSRYVAPDSTINVECEEVWDIQDGPSYDPKVYCEQNPVIRQAKVEPPSIRKNFKLAERQRHQMLSMQEKESVSKENQKPTCNQRSESEDSTRYDSSVDTLTSMSEQMSQLSMDEVPKTNKDGWTKIKGKRGRVGNRLK